MVPVATRARNLRATSVITIGIHLIKVKNKLLLLLLQKTKTNERMFNGRSEYGRGNEGGKKNTTLTFNSILLLLIYYYSTNYLYNYTNFAKHTKLAANFTRKPP